MGLQFKPILPTEPDAELTYGSENQAGAVSGQGSEFQ